MKSKLSLILAAALVLSLSSCVFASCGTNEEPLDGMYIITFELNGGQLNTGSTNITGKVYHAYYPDSKLIDVSSKMSRSGYVFDCWCTDEALTTPWDFTKTVKEDATLYARWKSAIVFSYTLYLPDGDNLKMLGRYEVQAGDAFKDVSGYGTSLTSYDKTFLGYYSDRQCSSEWNAEFKHPGGEQSVDIPVYVKAMDGVWTFVSDYEQLKNAVNNGANVWLTADIDCGGNTLFFADSQSNYVAKLNGNNHTVSNFKVDKKGTSRRPRYSLFGSMSAKASVVNVKFANVVFEVTEKAASEIKIGALAISAEAGATVSNVSVSGTFVNTTNIQLSLQDVNKPFCDETTVTAQNFSANIING